MDSLAELTLKLSWVERIRVNDQGGRWFFAIGRPRRGKPDRGDLAAVAVVADELFGHAAKSGVGNWLRHAGKFATLPEAAQVRVQGKQPSAERPQAIGDQGPPHDSRVIEWERDLVGGNKLAVEVGEGGGHGSGRGGRPAFSDGESRQTGRGGDDGVQHINRPRRGPLLFEDETTGGLAHLLSCVRV